MKKQILILVLLSLLFILAGIFFFTQNLSETKVTLSEKISDFLDVDNREAPYELQKAARKEASDIAALYRMESVPFVEIDAAEFNNDSESDKPQGVVVITGRKDSGEHLKVYGIEVDKAKSEFSRLFDELNYMHGLVAFANTQDTDLSFMRMSADEIIDSNENDDGLVYSYKRSTSEITPLRGTSGERNRNFSWSPENGYLALNRYVGETRYSSLLSIENWEAVIVDVNNDKLVLTIKEALHPKWVPGTSKIIYLKKDGLYSYDLESDSESKLYDINEGQVLVASNIDISPDGKYLLWSTSKKGTITIFKLSEKEALVTPVAQHIAPNTEYYWPTFSPDGGHYAVQAIDVFDSDAGMRSRPRLEVHELATGNVVFTKSLEEFDFNALYIDDWVSQSF